MRGFRMYWVFIFVCQFVLTVNLFAQDETFTVEKNAGFDLIGPITPIFKNGYFQAKGEFEFIQKRRYPISLSVRPYYSFSNGSDRITVESLFQQIGLSAGAKFPFLPNSKHTFLKGLYIGQFIGPAIGWYKPFASTGNYSGRNFDFTYHASLGYNHAFLKKIETSIELSAGYSFFYEGNYEMGGIFLSFFVKYKYQQKEKVKAKLSKSKSWYISPKIDLAAVSSRYTGLGSYVPGLPVEIEFSKYKDLSFFVKGYYASNRTLRNKAPYFEASELGFGIGARQYIPIFNKKYWGIRGVIEENFYLERSYSWEPLHGYPKILTNQYFFIPRIGLAFELFNTVQFLVTPGCWLAFNYRLPGPFFKQLYINAPILIGLKIPLN